MKSLTTTWLALLALTALSLALAVGLQGQISLAWLVAALVWLKSHLVSEHFLEASAIHPAIARVIRGFILFAPLGLLLTSV